MDDHFLHAGWMATLGVGLCLFVGSCSGSSSGTASGSDVGAGGGTEPAASEPAEHGSGLAGSGEVVPFTATDGDGDAVDFGENPRLVAFCDDWDENVSTPAVIMLYGTDEMIDFMTTVVFAGEADDDEFEIDTTELTSFISIRAPLSEVAEGGSFPLPGPSSPDEPLGVEVFLFDADVPDGTRQGEYVSGEGQGSGEATLGPIDCQEGSEIVVEVEAELFSELGDGGVAMVSGTAPATVTVLAPVTD